MADVWPKAGDKMVFLGKNGYPKELEGAKEKFDVGKQYTVRDISIGGFHHTIQFEEVKGWWNGVMFELVGSRYDGKYSGFFA